MVMLGGMVLVGRFSKRIQFPLLPPPPSDGEMMTPVFLLCAVVVVVFVFYFVAEYDNRVATNCCNESTVG